MHIYLFLIFILAAEIRASDVHVGTVLFTESDNTKDCWDVENIALLTSRMLLEDLLPSKNVIVIQDNGFINDIIDYFRLVLEVIRKMTEGKAKHITLLAVTDILGGYLNRYILPIAKHAYYTGLVDFDAMNKLYQLFDELKCFLRTNGHGWFKPITSFGNKQPLPQPLPMESPPPQTNPCKGLIYYENSSDDSGKNCSFTVPMPFFDSKSKPSSIAIPFKTYSLRNIESKSASYVLIKFYMIASKCLASHNVNPKSVTEFNVNFYAWLHEQVLPRLSDEKFYSAFGGVLRIQETLKRMGVPQTGNKEIGNYNIMPETQLKETGKEILAVPCTKKSKSNMILLALLTTIFIWFLLGSMFICYRIRAGRQSKGKGYDVSSDANKSESKPSSSLSAKKSSSSRSKRSSGSRYSRQETPTTLSTTPDMKSSGKQSSDSGSNGHYSPGVSSNLPEGANDKQQQPPSLTLYPTNCACHSSMTGKYRTTSSREESVAKANGAPLVLGYDLETSSSNASSSRVSEEVFNANEGNAANN